ncbi:DUF6232 family protein [Catellatospora sp. NPDC049133]|jgi:sterol desaturase/sphingolipid hydroxylase (fatty acid hydroxylase superfamily)|uniref:DUF6232 family protein n=1 Tax=Catellatospora sp. NPDC049133 TaxID=3155499 RepID=UPI0034015ED5
MIVYYRDPAVEVTSTAIHIHDRVFRLEDLEYVWHREITADPRSMRRLAGRGALNAGVVVGAVLALLGLIYLIAATVGDPGAAGRVLVPLAIVVLLVGLAGPMLEWILHRLDHSYDQGISMHEIWAVWRGRELLLLRVADESRFGRIYRSIQRALEQHR